jgi:hypothetical protein
MVRRHLRGAGGDRHEVALVNTSALGPDERDRSWNGPSARIGVRHRVRSAIGCHRTWIGIETRSTPPAFVTSIRRSPAVVGTKSKS